MNSKRFCVTFATVLIFVHASNAQVASYFFTGSNYNSFEGGSTPSLTPVNLGSATQSFITDTVTVGGTNYGSRIVLDRGGTSSSLNQAGVSLSTTSLLTNQNIYSVDMVFSFDTSLGNGYGRIINTNDNSDKGLYSLSQRTTLYDPSSPASGTGSLTYGISSYHHIAITNSGTNLNVYLDGVLDFTQTTTTALQNPDSIFRFFLDNQGDISAHNEYGIGRIASIRLWDEELTSSQVTAAFENPFQPVPEPVTPFLATTLFLGVCAKIRRRLAGVQKRS